MRRLDTTRPADASRRVAGLLLLAAFRPAWPRGHSRLLIAVAVIGIAGAFAVTSTLEPALAAVAAAAFLGVTLRPPQYAGGALTILAVLLLAPAGPDAP